MKVREVNWIQGGCNTMEGSNFLILPYIFIFFLNFFSGFNLSIFVLKFTLPLCKIKENISNQMLVTCKEGKLSNSSVPYSFCYFHYYISLTINNLVLFLLVDCEIASLGVLKCADLRTFLLPIMFDRRAFPVRMLPFAESTINTTTWHTTWQRKKKGRHKLI